MPGKPFDSLTAEPADLLPLALRRKDISKGSSLNGTSNSIRDGITWMKHDVLPLNGPKQNILYLHAKGEYYKLREGHHIPRTTNNNEVLVQVLAIGLNPVDWKGADFGFGQPGYPWINGRDFAGVVVRAPDNKDGRVKRGDVVFGSSTDYRDVRKAAFQEYLIANDFNLSRLPEGADATIHEAAALGTAWVASSIGLGVCFGMDWAKLRDDSIPKGPDLLSIARKHIADVSEDVQPEVKDGIDDEELPQPGEWIVIWGGGGVTGQFFCQLAKLAGLKVACVDDLTQVGGKLAELGLDFIIDFKAYEPERIVEILRAVTGGKLRFGVDTVGKKTAQEVLKVVQPSANGRKAHIIGLSGLPDDEPEGIVKHAPPLKLFHEIVDFGSGLSDWLEELIISKSISMPDLDLAEGGLDGVNDALDRLRNGQVMGKRVVVPIQRQKQINGEEEVNGQ